MTIRTRLGLACLFLLALNAGLGLFARDQQHRMGEQAMSIYDGSYIGLSFVTRVQTGLIRLESAFTDPASHLTIEQCNAELGRLIRHLDVAIDRAMSPKAREQSLALRAKFQAVIRETNRGARQAGLAEIDENLVALVHRFGADGLTTRDAVESAVERGDRLVAGVTLGVALLSFGIALLVGLSVLPPLHRAVKVADAIADGNLDSDIEMSGPRETVRLMRALDIMQSAIAENLRRIEAQHEAESLIRENSLRRENEEIRERQRIAEEASRAKSAFLAMMSHEIRTPMNAVLGLTSTLLSEALNPDQRQVVRAIHGSGNSLLRILNDILDFSRLDAGRMTFELIPFSPSTLTQETLSVHGPVAMEKGLRLEVNQSPDLPPRLIGDAGRIGQVLHNLVSNAIKFTRSGGVTVNARLVDVNESKAMLEWTIIDTGIGIAADKLTKLFDAFVQAEDSITRRFGGSGLGLAISKQLVEQMGGEIVAKSTPGLGSTFLARLELEIAAQTEIREDLPGFEAQFAHQMEVLGRPLKLLLAEDNPVNKFVFSRLLKGSPIDINIADNGLEAVRAAELTDYDLICMDMSMPEMDGLEATREIRRGGGPCASIPIVAMTANAFPEDVAACRDAGMTDFVSKPISRQTLLAAILRAMPTGSHAGIQTPASEKPDLVMAAGF